MLENTFLSCWSSETLLVSHSDENENSVINWHAITLYAMSANSINFNKTDYKVTEGYALLNWKEIFS